MLLYTLKTAAELLNTYDPARLATLFGRYGELDKCYRIANAIVRYRETAGPFARIDDLLRATESVTPRGGESRFRARLFQALRIEVNGEMQALEMMLSQSIRLLRPGGRRSVITYHSLEDRLVKNFMRTGNLEGRLEKDFYGRPLSPLRPVTSKAVTPDAEEIERNPRSRSAKLRVATRI